MKKYITECDSGEDPVSAGGYLRKGEKMARTEAQKRADAKYQQKTKGRYVNFSAHLQKDEAAELEALLKKHGLTHADFVRRSAEKLKNE